VPNSTVSSTVPPRKGEHMCLGAVRGTAPNDGLSVPPTAAGPKPSPPFYGMRRGTAHAPQPPWRTLVGEGRPGPLSISFA
jgi:hypothetical protein